MEGLAPPPSVGGPSETTTGGATYNWEPVGQGVEYELTFTIQGQDARGVAYRGSNTSVDFAFPSSGTFDLAVRTCFGPTCSAFSPPTTTVVSVPLEAALDSTCPPSISLPVPTDENVGAIEGQASVSNGAARYTIPILVPPGRREMQPRVALSYSSSGGGELAGFGWSLSPASRVSRCSRNVRIDGRRIAYDYSATDRLCLDGNRLILKSGSYGADGSTYLTESNQFAEVKLSGDLQDPSGAGAVFEVRHKSGRLSYYGAESSRTDPLERRAGTQVPVAWWLAKEQDFSGNFISYHYRTLDDVALYHRHLDGQHVLEEIQYTGFQTMPGDRVVRFEYEDRPDKRTRYHRGAMTRLTRRLAAVTSWAGADLVRRYEFDYETSAGTGRSLLSSLTTCTTTPCSQASSLPPTEFEYGDEPPVFINEDLSSDQQDYLVLGHDYDGDGHRDLIYSRLATPCGGSAVISRAELSGTPGSVNLLGSGAPWKAGFDRTLASISGYGNPDIDGDGRVDFVGTIFREGAEWFAIRSNGEVVVSDLQVSTGQNREHYADFNGDGATDIIWFEGASGYRLFLQNESEPGSLAFVENGPSFPSLATNEHVTLVSDFDGNGLPDIFVDWNTTSGAPPQGYEPKIVFLNPHQSRDVSFSVDTVPSLGGPIGPLEGGVTRSSSFEDLGSASLVDINGDGLLDIRGGGLYINNGGRFQPGLLSMNNTTRRMARTTQPNPFLAMDYDGDGVDEFLLPESPVNEWCVTIYGSNAAYDLPYCTFERPNLRTFEHDDAPRHLDRTLYQWNYSKLIDGGLGLYDLSVSGPTGIIAPPQARIEEHGGDGLSDVVAYLHNIYPPPTSPSYCEVEPNPLGYYPNGDVPSLGTKISRRSGSAPDLLVEVRDGVGVVNQWTHSAMSAKTTTPGCPAESPLYEIDHEKYASDPSRFAFTSSMPVVSKFEQSNGLGGLNRTCYRYDTAVADNEGGGFLGFERIVEEEAYLLATSSTASDPNNLKTIYEYRLGFPFDGALARSSTFLASDSASALPIQDTQTKHRENCVSPAGVGPRACFVYAERSVVTQRDPSSRVWVSTSTTEVEFKEPEDRAYGNPTLVSTSIEDPSVVRERVVETVFDYTDIPVWINKAVRKTNTHRVRYKEPPNESSNPPMVQPDTSVVEDFEYYDLGHAFSRQPKTKWVQQGVPDQWRRTDFARYDIYGNVEELSTEAASASARRTVKTAHGWDGYFMSWTENGLGHRALVNDVDKRFGIVLSSSDVRQVATHTEVDSWGNVVRQTVAGESPVTFHRRWCTTCPPNGVYETIRWQDGAPVLTTVRDRLGRAIESRETAFDSTEEVRVSTAFDARGHRVARSEPSYLLAPQYFTRYGGFDALGRPAFKTIDRTGHVDHAGQPRSTFRVDYTYAGLEVTVTLDEQLVARRRFDAGGKLINAVDTTGERTVYRYDGLGNQTLIRDPYDNDVLAQFDALGRRVVVEDADRGRTEFAYNGFGEVREQRTPNDVVGLEYDIAGRLERRTVNGRLEASFDYDATLPGTLHAEKKWLVGGGLEYQRTLTYDSISRPAAAVVAADGQSYTTRTAYDCRGKPRAVEHPNGEAVEFWYNATGHLVEETNPKSPGLPESYRRVLEMNARGQITSELYGNGLVGSSEYVEATGSLVRQCVGVPGDPCGMSSRQHLEYGYEDAWGNLTYRIKHMDSSYLSMRSVREQFEYDDRFRLKKAHRTWDGVPHEEVVEYDYDALGNLLQKEDFAETYVYGDRDRTNANAGPHAVTSVTLSDGTVVDDYSYDDAGNQRTGRGREIEYSWLNKPTRIVEDGSETRFMYGPNHMKFREVSAGAIRRYPSPLFEDEVVAGSTEERVYLGQSVLVVSTVGGSREVRYLHMDRLGSVETVTDAGGARIESHGYDAFGGPRRSDWETSGLELHSGEFAVESTLRGFTGHEHLDAHRLVHTEGRLYDPELGRFLSPDPFVADVADLESINPYSYVQNNPLASVDPSGYLGTSICGRSSAASPTNCSNFSGADASPAAADSPVVAAEAGDEANTAAVSPDQLGSPEVVVAQIEELTKRLLDHLRDSDSQLDQGTAMLVAGLMQLVSLGDEYASQVGVQAVVQLQLAVLGETLRRVDPYNELGTNLVGTGLLAPLGAAVSGARLVAAARASRLSGLLKMGGALDDILRLRCTVCDTLCFVEGTPVATQHGNRPIEMLRVGDRVLTLTGETSSLEGRYSRISILLLKDSDPGDRYLIELLRRPAWLLNSGFDGVGGTGRLALPELGVAGTATVLSVRDAAIEPGVGRVVMGTVSHDDPDLYELTFHDQGVLRPTRRHPLFSLDRRMWIRTEDLRIGERLQTRRGSVAIRAKRDVVGRHRVYNLEVDGEHEFLVGPDQVRTHNSSILSCGSRAPARFSSITGRWHDALGKFRAPPTAQEMRSWAKSQGWANTHTTPAGFETWSDSVGVRRMKLKPASTMPGVQPMSQQPRVTIWNAAGQRVDGFGRPVARKSLSAHAPLADSP